MALALLVTGQDRNRQRLATLNHNPMNVLSALVFAALGAVMETLPRAFPSWFPPTGASETSGRALWLDLMGAVQLSMGLGFIVRMQVVPVVFRLLSMVPAGEPGALALVNPRGATGR